MEAKGAVAPGGTFLVGGTKGFMFESQWLFLFTSYNYDNNFPILTFSFCLIDPKNVNNITEFKPCM